jgi:LmbE family N-acetylglucosaminyl deacetylase
MRARPNTLSIEAFVKVREEEARRAERFWGSQPRTLRFYALKDGRLADNRRLLRDRLVDLLETINPDLYKTASNVGFAQQLREGRCR